MADSKYKREFNNSITMPNFKKENTYRYMSVTPNNKLHNPKPAHDFRYTKSHLQKDLITTNSINNKNDLRKTDLTVNNLTEPPKYKNTTIEEVKDEYNDSKLSFNDLNDDPKHKYLELDIEAMIIVEDKI